MGRRGRFLRRVRLVDARAPPPLHEPASAALPTAPTSLRPTVPKLPPHESDIVENFNSPKLRTIVLVPRMRPTSFSFLCTLGEPARRRTLISGAADFPRLSNHSGTLALRQPNSRRSVHAIRIPASLYRCYETVRAPWNRHHRLPVHGSPSNAVPSENHHKAANLGTRRTKVKARTVIGRFRCSNDGIVPGLSPNTFDGALPLVRETRT